MSHSMPPEPEKLGGCATPLFGVLLVVFVMTIVYEAGIIEGKKTAQCPALTTTPESN